MSQQLMAMILTTVGAGLAFAFTYIWVRRLAIAGVANASTS